MEQQVYKKVGRKYIPIGYSDGWTGFPTDGIWVVQTKPGHHSSECIMKIGEVQNMQPALDLLIAYKDKMVRYIADNPIHNISYNDFVSNMIKEITKNEQK